MMMIHVGICDACREGRRQSQRVSERHMKTRLHRHRLWATLASGCLLQGCNLMDQTLIDPDLQLRAGLSLFSDLATFLLQNLAAGL